jgi:putative transposase
LSKSECLELVDRESDLSLRRQCQLLGISRSRLYGTSILSDESETANHIIEIYGQSGCRYGYRKVHASLQSQGMVINKKKVQRLMKELDIQGLYPKKRQGTITDSSLQIYPYLLDNLLINQTNQVWATDITYIKLPNRFMCLIAIIDLYSRYIVAYGLSHSLDKEFYVYVLQQALKLAKPQIFNSDQGCQFTSHDFVNTLINNNIIISMDHKGRCFDNIRIERFWRTLKQEAIYYYRPETIGSLVSCIDEFIPWYNQTRKHQALAYKTPAELYNQSY